MPDLDAKAAPNWKAVAARLIAEPAPQKIFTHARELVKALDEHSKRRPKTEEDSSLPKVRANARVRCPYCAENGKFREMSAQYDSVMVCSNCGHTTRPQDPDYLCNCLHCGQLALFTSSH